MTRPKSVCLALACYLYCLTTTTTVRVAAVAVASGGIGPSSFSLISARRDDDDDVSRSRFFAASRNGNRLIDAVLRRTGPSPRRQFVCDSHADVHDNDELLLLVSTSERPLWRPREKPSSAVVIEPDGPADRDVEDESDNANPNFWPPWPFSLLSKDNADESSNAALSNNNNNRSQRQPGAAASRGTKYKSMANVAWTCAQTTATVGFRHVQHVGSQLWFHLPPAAPPLLLLASLPVRQALVTPTAEAAAATATQQSQELLYHRVFPLFANPFCRSLALSGTGWALVSWAHSELQRHRKLTPLPLDPRYRDVHRAVRPPFLPSERIVVPSLDFLNAATTTTTKAKESRKKQDGNEDDVDEDDEPVASWMPPRFQKHWKEWINQESASSAEGDDDDSSINAVVSFGTSLRTIWKKFRRSRTVNVDERHNAHRLAVYDELLALQVLKRQQHRQQQRKRGSSSASVSSDDDTAEAGSPLGYALVTGASQGIGRAIAVELARWEIPLILVARNQDALVALAEDLQACYGVNCCVLPADLAQPQCAEKIFETVEKAGLHVDFLVNNAGISSQGESVDLPMERIQRMIQVNTVAVTSLSHLFGRAMKENGRGRILMVSSVCGSVSGIATMAVYSATKAFENSLGRSLAKELEPHGVGVTCLLPGAVSGTEFKSRSNVQEALCWKLPFYTRTAPTVAEAGVRAMLRGESEVIPGVLNRVFMKVVQPVLPQRLHNLIAETMFQPVQLPWQPNHPRTVESNEDNERTVSSISMDESTHASVRPRSFNYRSTSPRMLQIKPDRPAVPNIIAALPSLQEESTLLGDHKIRKEDNGNVTNSSSIVLEGGPQMPDSIASKVQATTSENPQPQPPQLKQEFEDRHVYSPKKPTVSPSPISTPDHKIEQYSSGPSTNKPAKGRIKERPPKQDEHARSPVPDEPEKSTVRVDDRSELEMLLEQYQRDRLFGLHSRSIRD